MKQLSIVVAFSHGEHVNNLPPSCTLCHLYRIVDATPSFLISLLFPLNFSYLNLSSPPFVAPVLLPSPAAGGGEEKRGSEQCTVWSDLVGI